MKQALFAGTFDPPTLGHLEIIERARHLFGRLIIGIGENSAKQDSLLTESEKLSVLIDATSGYDNVEIVSFTGLVTTFAKTRGIDFLVRSMRSTDDFEWERQMAVANRKVAGIDTLFLLSDAHSHISSTLIRELASQGAPLTEFVPEQVEQILHKKLK